MKFSELFIRKPVMTVLVVITVLLYGIWTYMKLPISDLPSVDSPVITINVSYPGASPETMASTVASPLENQCMQIPGLVTMISTNTEGTTQITLTFDLDRNVDLAAPDVQAAISRSMGNLPTDLPSPPTYTKTNPADKPIIYILVKSKLLTEGELYDIGNKVIGQRISMINGISAVNIYGAKRSVRIQVDPNKLSNSGVSLDEIAKLLNASTVTVPGGSLDGKKQTFSIEPQGQLFDAAEYENLIIKYVNGAPLRIRDVGVAINSTQNDVLRTMYAGKDYPLSKGATVIMATRRGGTNTVVLTKEILDLLEEIKPQLPSSVEVVVLYNRASSIIDSINDVKTTVYLALILVVLVIFLFLGRISDTIIPSITLPFSILCTFIVMYAANFSLDNLSLMAIMLAIGFVVDDAIVVLENTVRLVEEGHKPFDAAVLSARQITATVVSMTLSLSIIFAPLVFMGGVVGRTFREFSLTVVVCIICSGIVALTLTPMMCARMLKPSDKLKKNFFQRAVDACMNSTIRGYGVTLKFVLRNVWLSVVMWIACLFGTYWFFMQLPQTFLPIGDSGLLLGGIIVPLDTSSKQMQKFQDEINEKLLADPNVDYFLTVTGSDPGADQSMGFIVVRLVETAKRKLASNPDKKNPTIDEVNHELSGRLMMGAKNPLGFAVLSPMPVLELSLGGEDTAQGCKYSYRVSGSEREDVYQAAEKIVGAMYGIEGVAANSIQSTVKLDMPQLKVKILRDRASTFGITAQDVEMALANSFAQGKTTQFTTELDQYYVTLELDKSYQTKPIDLSAIYLRAASTGKLVPLASVAEWKQDIGPQNVPHFQQMHSATLSFNLLPDAPIGPVTDAIEAAAKKLMPPGVKGGFQGEALEFQNSMNSMYFLIVIALFMSYVVLGILYESYIHPFTVLTTLPVAAFGGLGTLYFCNSELSLYAFIGLFMLLGIVKKNGIMMVDFANEIMDKEHKSSKDAIYDACLVRFRPILMTGVAAIMGAVPLALGIGMDGSSRRPLGLIIVGGLIFSQVITLYVTPGIYLVMERFQEIFLDRFELTRSDAARHVLAEKEAALAAAESKSSGAQSEGAPPEPPLAVV